MRSFSLRSAVLLCTVPRLSTSPVPSHYVAMSGVFTEGIYDNVGGVRYKDTMSGHQCSAGVFRVSGDIVSHH